MNYTEVGFSLKSGFKNKNDFTYILANFVTDAVLSWNEFFVKNCALFGVNIFRKNSCLCKKKITKSQKAALSTFH